MSAPTVSVVLLAAGYGTRLYPLTKERSKALLPLGDGVVLDPILETVAGVPRLSKIILVTNHRFAAQFRDWRPRRPIAFDVLDDGTSTPETRLGAIRDLALAMERIPAGEDVVVLGTDNLFSWPLAAFAEFAASKRPASTIAVGEVESWEVARQSGVVELAPDGRVLRLVEKSPQPPSRIIAFCVYYFPTSMRPRIGQFIAGGGNPDAPGYLIEWLVRQDAVYAYLTRGDWFDIGSQEAYQHAQVRWTGGSPVRSP